MKFNNTNNRKLRLAKNFKKPIIRMAHKTPLEIAIEERMKTYDQLLTAKTITQEFYDKYKFEVVREEVQKDQDRQKAVTANFSKDEIERQPWLKELLNQQDMWQRHYKTIKEDESAWEQKMKENFMAKATAGRLSPLQCIIGQGLLFFPDREEGRRHLLHLLFGLDPKDRLPAHNWFMLSTAGMGTAIDEGRKVKKMTVPLFPFSEHPLRELNAEILEAVDEGMEGGEPDDKQKLVRFLKDEDVLGVTKYYGGSNKQVLDANGQPTNLFVVMDDVEQACFQIVQAYQNGDRNLLSLIEALQKTVSSIKRGMNTRRQEVVVHHVHDTDRRWRGASRGRGRGGRGRGYRGGEVEEMSFSKNEEAPL